MRDDCPPSTLAMMGNYQTTYIGSDANGPFYQKLYTVSVLVAWGLTTNMLSAYYLSDLVGIAKFAVAVRGLAPRIPYLGIQQEEELNYLFEALHLDFLLVVPIQEAEVKIVQLEDLLLLSLFFVF